MFLIQGEKEMFVNAGMIRSLEPAGGGGGYGSPTRGSSGGEVVFREGDKVESL